jgi:histidinol-phosphate aminotransferase
VSFRPMCPASSRCIANLVKLNTNESPFGPSPLALEAMRAAAVDTLRLYPDPEAQELREALAVHHGIKPEQVFIGNGSDEVLAHTFVALLKQPKPLLFPDVTYSFYPVWAQLFGLACGLCRWTRYRQRVRGKCPHNRLREDFFPAR